MDKSFMIAGAVLAGLAVMLGAFGAHGLQKVTSDMKVIHGFQTGVQYQFYHAIAILVAAMLFSRFPESAIRWAMILFVIGIVLFSGSLYLLTYLKIHGNAAVRIIGPVTPIGGLAFVAGWILLIVGLMKK